MDIHRCRFVPYPASAINAVAFSHPHLSTAKKSNKTTPARLAIGRANGDIEIWNPLNGSWHQETIIHGGKDRSVDGLVWITGEDEELADGKIIHGKSRLFSIGYTSTVTEWDLVNARAKKHASGQHNDIWCLGAQPIAPGGQATQRLVAGTIDGALVLYSTEDDDLRFQRILTRQVKNVKIVSIAFQSRHVGVIGCSDSTIRTFDLRNGAVLRQMTLGRDLAGGSKDIIVWSVKCLSNGDIVSGDSTGQICIWDGKTYTQAQRIQSHTQDVLSLATSADGSAIVSGGMDRRTVLYRQIPGQASRWAKVWHRRYHTHDVKTMASFEGQGMSVVVTGGPDASPIVVPLQRAGMEHHRNLSHLPQSTPLRSAPKVRLVIGWWEREVHIWKLRRQTSELLDGSSAEVDVAKNRKLLGRVLIKGESNITSASISHDGSLLVVTTVSEVKAFKLKLLDAPDQEKVSISKVQVPSQLAAKGATAVEISPDGLWISLVQPGGRVVMARVLKKQSEDGEELSIHSKSHELRRLKRNVHKNLLLGGLGPYDRQITHAAFSADSRMLAVADLAGYIDTWILHGPVDNLQNGVASEDGDDDAESSSSSSSDESSDDGEEDDTEGLGYHWLRNPKSSLMPKLSAAPVALSFSNDSPESSGRDPEKHGDYVLLAVTTTGTIFTFHPLQGKLTPWSRRAPAVRLPEQYRNIRDLVKGVLWQGPRIWIYGVSFLFMIDTSIEPSSKEVVAAEQQQQQGLKRKRGAGGGAGGKMDRHAVGLQQVRVTKGEGPHKEWVDVEMGDGGDDAQSAASGGDMDQDYDDDDDDTDGGELQLLRDSEEQKQLAKGQQDGEQQQQQGDQRKRWWHTFKYRPILGIVALEGEKPPALTNGAAAAAAGGGGAEEVEATAYPPLEVVLVERPIWDADLPARFEGEDDWNR